MVAASSSCPQFNIKDVNNALITLLQNPDCDFDEIYCAPDFATGAILLNADEVKESIINAYEIKTNQSRAKLSHMMDEETWMNANKAIELGFADDILRDF